jgi:hypothetical protein
MSRRLVVDYFASADRPGASTRRAACHADRRAARRRLLHLRRASGCLGTSRLSSRRLSSTTPCRAGSSSTTSRPPGFRVPRHVARLVAQARRGLLRLRCTSGCLGMSRGSSRGSPRDSSSTTSPTPCVWVPRHIARLIACRRLLRLLHTTECLGTSRGSSRGSSCRSSSTTSRPPRVRVPRHVARLVAPLVVDYSTSRRLVIDYSASLRLVVDNSASRRLIIDYFASAARPSLSARRAPRHAARRRLLRLAPLVVDYFASAARPGASARRVARRATRRRLLHVA